MKSRQAEGRVFTSIRATKKTMELVSEFRRELLAKDIQHKIIAEQILNATTDEILFTALRIALREIRGIRDTLIKGGEISANQTAPDDLRGGTLSDLPAVRGDE
jgi:hypothetical protein